MKILAYFQYYSSTSCHVKAYTVWRTFKKGNFVILRNVSCDLPTYKCKQMAMANSLKKNLKSRWHTCYPEHTEVVISHCMLMIRWTDYLEPMANYFKMVNISLSSFMGKNLIFKGYRDIQNLGNTTKSVFYMVSGPYHKYTA